MKPLVKWAGGKARLADQICLAFNSPCEGRYIEPFLGSGAVFLHMRAKGLVPGRAILSDVNGKLIEMHRAIRDHVERVLHELSRLPHDDWEDRYYEVREAYNEGPWEGPAHAARFIWLNRGCFNGLYRENRSGRFNVPVGRYKRLSIPDPSRFREVSEALQGTRLRVDPFDEVMAEADEGDHVYCDPPYVPLSATANFTAYSKQAFGHDEQLSLAESARHAAVRGATVVLSNHDLPIVREELYPKDHGFDYVATPRVRRAISRKGKGRKRVGEVIAAIGPATAVPVPG